MEDIFTQLKKAQGVKMTDAERAAIRKNLMNISGGSYVAPTNASVASPYTSSFGMMGLFAKAAAFALVGFIVGGTSLSFASMKALPGDSLYAVKTNITEKLAGTFTFSTESKTKINAGHVATRVTEIKAVRENGSINDPRVALETESSFNATFATYTESLDKLRSEGRVARSQEIALATLADIQTVAPARPEPVTMMMSAKMAPMGGAPVATMMATDAQIESPDTSLSGLDAALSNAVTAIEVIAGIGVNSGIVTPETETPNQEVLNTNNPTEAPKPVSNEPIIEVQTPVEVETAVEAPNPILEPAPETKSTLKVR